MGIPKLNKWLLERCSPPSIQKRKLDEFQDKRIAIDMSIYLYKFLIDNKFMENLYLFLSILRYNCIEPVIIFDGKSPPEKCATIQRRRTEKQEACTQCQTFEEQLSQETDETIRQMLIQKIAMLKKRMVKITWAHIDNAIELIQSFGFEYYIAPYEADQLCVHLAVTGDVYAVLSDDMDLIISGVPRIMRILNMITHEIYFYDTPSILSDISMTLDDFRNTIILCGTDYEMNILHPNFTLKKCFELYEEYKKSGENQYHLWLGNKGIVEPCEFQRVSSLFDSNSFSNELTEFVKKNRPTIRPKINIKIIQEIMRRHKFIFVSSL